MMLNESSFKEAEMATQVLWARGRRLTALVLLISLASVPAMAGVTTRVSVDSQGRESHGVYNFSVPGDIISSDNGYYVVAFDSSASNLAPVDTNNAMDIFIHESRTGKTQRVSVGKAGKQANGTSWTPRLSADGRYVTFISYASNLVSGDTNKNYDVFVYDRKTGVTSRVNVSTFGEEANSYSLFPSISADGRYVAFMSEASNLVPDDTNSSADVFVHDRKTRVTSRVSVSTFGGQGNYYSSSPSLSADGRYVAFTSEASNLVVGDTNSGVDVFVHDRKTGKTERVSVNTSGEQGNEYSYSWAPRLSANGRYVAFESSAWNLIPGDTNINSDIFIHDRWTKQTSRVSVSTSGEQANDYSNSPSISADGRYVAFTSYASNLVAGDTNVRSDIFIHDRKTSKTKRMSVNSTGEQGNGSSVHPSLSANGRYVAFSSQSSNLVEGDKNNNLDAFAYDRLSTQLGKPSKNYEK